MQETAVAYYTEKYGVTKGEARRRIEIQDSVMPSLGAIEAALGDRYGGAWFDSDDDGDLRIAVVNLGSKDAADGVEQAKALLGNAFSFSGAKFVDVESSYDSLVRASDELARTLGTQGASSEIATVGVDVRRNSVAVTRSADLSAERREQIDQAKRQMSVSVHENAVASRFAARTRCSNSMPLSPFCDRPLRGGVEINSYGNYCTAGFNVTSRSDGKRYLMTAAHCLTNGDWATKTNLYGQWLNIGPEHNMSYYYTGRDAGIIRATTPSYWQQSPFPAPWVWVDDIPGGSVTYDPSYHISNESNAPVGTVVCMTGGAGRASGNRARFWEGAPWASYTWCGTVTVASESVMFFNDPSQHVHNLVRTDVCFHSGMSGGPVYKNHLAYGTISGDACDSGYQWGWYYPAILAENLLNVNIVH